LGKRSTKKNISVQPTAIARRKDRAGLTKGSKRIQAGHPSKVETIQLKKKSQNKFRSKQTQCNISLALHFYTKTQNTACNTA